MAKRQPPTTAPWPWIHLWPWWLLVWFLWPFLMGSTIVQPEGGDMRELFKGKGVFVAEVICMITLAGAMMF